MPKEIVRTANARFRVDKDGNELSTDDAPVGPGDIVQRAVVVRWGPHGGYVELGVAKVDDWNGDESDAHYLTLDRQAVNWLIRSLRTSRDKAYGRDE